MFLVRFLILTCTLVVLGAPARSAETPAQASISAAREALKNNADNAEAYAALAVALARRARETSDTRYYTEAEAAAKRSLEIAPANLAGERALVWVLLGKHEFAQALQGAQALNDRIPDDVLTYGFLADANVELGNYAAAEDAVQWMLDLRSGNVPGLTRAAHLRELFGDVEGALELMTMAYQRTVPSEVEDRAWVLTHVAHLELMRGRIDLAEPLLDQALLLFPDYHYALANLARVRLAQDRAQDAVELLARRHRNAPHPENLYALGEAQLRAGHPDEARAAFAEFEEKARKEMPNWDNANRDLIFYLVDHAQRPAAALQVAKLESARRRDVFTLEALAWALHANGRHAEARRTIEEALAVGIREPAMLYRAAAIAEGAGDLRAAQAYAAQSLRLGPHNELAAPARELLARLDHSAAR
jgi:tetratricopeptide (TPR) repeat protein